MNLTSTQGLAPAKVNLYLHVGAARSDGRHPLCSLVMFADEQAADQITFRSAARFSLVVRGSNAAASGPVDDNLVMQAATAMAEASPDLEPQAMELEKALPVAAGLGGGSSDAAAVLRVLGAQSDMSEDELLAIAARLGGDVPACVLASACLMEGDGDRVARVHGLAPLPALLVNPRITCPTAPVFATFDTFDCARSGLDPVPVPTENADPRALIAVLAEETGNDLEAPACSLVPEIRTVLETLKTLPNARMVRMSGSGASCFALFDSMADAHTARDELDRMQVTWWARPVLLR